jgi:hypothetical protein
MAEPIFMKLGVYIMVPFVVQPRTCRVQICVGFHYNWRLSHVLLFMTDQSSQMRSGQKQQEVSVFRSRVIEASVAEMHCCNFAPLLLVMVFPCGVEGRGFA